MMEPRKFAPLCVDLDHTLIRTDILWELIVQLWRRPFLLLSALVALLKNGKAAFKTVLAKKLEIDPATLPYHQEVLDFIRAQNEIGREVVLATATHRIVAERIADHLRIFSRVLSTEGQVNLSGLHKRDALIAIYGKQGFDYIGDNQKDLPIFSAAREALLVNPSPSLLKRASAIAHVSRVFSEDRLNAKVIAKATRLHQWAKNVLLVVPLLSAHMVLSAQAWINVIIAFLSFGLVASSTYLINDLADLRSDRLHSHKRFRPLASGRLSIYAGLLLSITFGFLGFGISIALLPFGFTVYIIAYVALTLAYSFDLKRRLLVDALALAILYTMRILAGGAAVGVVVSEWLLMFSLFMFLSLAFLKRAIELKGAEENKRISGRAYSSIDLETVRVIGVSSGLMSVLVLSLYINSPAVSQLYQSPQMIWLICPLLIYWVARIWFLAGRGQVDHDPVVFALLDWRSYVLGACGLIIVIFAKIGPPSLHW